MIYTYQSPIILPGVDLLSLWCLWSWGIPPQTWVGPCLHLGPQVWFARMLACATLGYSSYSASLSLWYVDAPSGLLDVLLWPGWNRSLRQHFALWAVSRAWGCVRPEQWFSKWGAWNPGGRLQGLGMFQITTVWCCKVMPGGLWGQNCLHNHAKISFSFFSVLAFALMVQKQQGVSLLAPQHSQVSGTKTASSSS